MIIFKRKFGLGLLGLLIILICVFLYVFWGAKVENLLFVSLTEHGPLSLNKAASLVSLPLYYPDEGTTYQNENIQVAYYYFDYGAEQILDAYYSSSGKRVALMKLYKNLAPTVAISRPEPILIRWADRGIAQPCEIPSFIHDKDRISGSPYYSCLTWIANGNHYIFYGIWPEDDSINFVNSLVEIERK